MAQVLDFAQLLEEFEDWKVGLKYADDGPQAFIEAREQARLARNGSAVLMFLDDLEEESGPDDTGIVGVVRYLLNAEVGDPEVEEWFKPAAPANESPAIDTTALKGYLAGEGHYIEEI